eukprot:gene6072-4370_t
MYYLENYLEIKKNMRFLNFQLRMYRHCNIAQRRNSREGMEVEFRNSNMFCPASYSAFFIFFLCVFYYYLFILINLNILVSERRQKQSENISINIINIITIIIMSSFNSSKYNTVKKVMLEY